MKRLICQSQTAGKTINKNRGSAVFNQLSIDSKVTGTIHTLLHLARRTGDKCDLIRFRQPEPGQIMVHPIIDSSRYPSLCLFRSLSAE